MASEARRQRRAEKSRRRSGSGAQDPGSLAAAIGQHKAGNIDAAEAGYRSVLAKHPKSVPALQYLGVICAERADYAEAEDLLAEAARLAPTSGEVLANLAVCQRQRESYEACFRTARKALQFEPDNTAARFSRAVAARELKDFQSALADLDRLHAEQPDNLTVAYERGRAAMGAGRYGDAVAILRDALRQRPGEPGLVINLAMALSQHGDPQAALETLDAEAAGLQAYPYWHDARGLALSALRRRSEALTAHRQAVALDPDAAELKLHLGDALRELGALAEAERVAGAAVAALEADPRATAFYVAVAWNNYANTLREQARSWEATDAFRQALRWHPEAAYIHSNLLLALHYDTREDADSIHREHLAWQQRHAAKLEAAARPPAPGSPDKAPLTVGIVAGKQRRGPALLLYLRAFENLDPGQIRLIVYDLGSRHDDLTERLEAASSAWRDITELDDAAVADQVRRDQVDILIHKMGHAEGRPLICAHKPAPVQVQWGGFNTSALAGMDWFLGDPVETPPGCEGYYSERIYRLPDDYVVFDVPQSDLQPGPLPARQAGAVTFGCFNTPTKINAETAQLWAEILAAVPDSQLLLKGTAFDDPEGSAYLRELLRTAGIPEARLIAEGPSQRGALLQRYQSVDIALDPWPYSGGLTTLEALWMGVPVVTLPGPTFVGRHAASHLSAAGLGDWVAADRTDYVHKAVAAARDWDSLAAQRAGLRARLEASPVCDGPRFARNLESALAYMWRDKAGPAAA